MSILSLSNWRSWQSMYRHSNHEDFDKLNGLERQKKGKRDWDKIKSMESSEHGMQYKCIIDKYQSKATTTKKDKKRNLKCLNDGNDDNDCIENQPLLKKMKLQTTPAIALLNQKLSFSQNNLCVLVS